MLLLLLLVVVVLVVSLIDRQLRHHRDHVCSVAETTHDAGVHRDHCPTDAVQLVMGPSQLYRIRLSHALKSRFRDHVFSIQYLYTDMQHIDSV